jgi:predicted dehydrogenase
MAGIIEFANGRIATFDCGFTNPLRMHLEIVCEKGVLRVPRMWLPEPEASYEIEFSDGGREQGTVPGHDQIACLIENLSMKVLGKPNSIPCGTNPYKTLSVLDALAKSARENRPIEVIQQ